MVGKQNRRRIHIGRTASAIALAIAGIGFSQHARADGEFGLQIYSNHTWETGPWGRNGDTGAQIFPGDDKSDGTENAMLAGYFHERNVKVTLVGPAGWNYALGSLTARNVENSVRSLLTLAAVNPGTFTTNQLTLMRSSVRNVIDMNLASNISIATPNNAAQVLNVANTFGNDGQLIINGVIKSAGLVVANYGGVVLNGTNNAIAGDVEHHAGGSLTIAGDGSLGTAGNINLSNNSTLNVAGNFTLGAGRILNIGTGGASIRPYYGVTMTLGAGQLAGSGQLIKHQSGVLVLAGANPGFTGDVWIGWGDGGILEARDVNALGDTAGNVGAIRIGNSHPFYKNFVYAVNYPNFNANPAKEMGRITSASDGVLALGQNTSNPLDFTNTPLLRLSATSTVLNVNHLTPGVTVSGPITPGANGYLFGGEPANFAPTATNIPAGQTFANGRLIIDTSLGGNAKLTQKVHGLTQLNQANTYTGQTIINGGTLYLNHPSAAALTSGIIVNAQVPFGETNIGALLLNPDMTYVGGGTNISLQGGAIGWTGNKLITAIESKFSHLGGPHSSGIMSQDGVHAFAGGKLVKSGVFSTLDLTNAPPGGNTFTGGLDIYSGTVLFSAINQLGTGKVGGAYGILKLKPGSGQFNMGNVVLEATAGNDANPEVGFGIDVSSGDTMIINKPWEVGSAERNVFIKLGAGTLEYLPTPLVSAGGTTYTYGLNIAQGTMRINQLPYGGIFHENGMLEFSGEGTLIVDPAPGDVTALPNFDNHAYGFQYVSVFNRASARIELGANTLFNATGSSFTQRPFVTDGSTLTVAGAGANNGSRFHLNLNDFVPAAPTITTGQAGTLDLQKVAFTVSATAAENFWPAERGFTVKLNDASLNGAYVNDPGNLTHIGHFAANDQPTAMTSTWDNFNLAGAGNTSFGKILEKVGDGTVTVNRSGGSVSIAPGATLIVNGGTLRVGGDIDPFTDSTDLAKHATIQNQATFEVTAGIKHIEALINAPHVVAGKTIIAPDAELRTNRLIQAEVNIGHASAIRINSAAQPGQINNKVVALSIANDNGSATGTLDLGNSNLLIDYAPGATPISDIREMLRQGYAEGSWTGPGIISSAAAAHNKRTIGYGASNVVLGINDLDRGEFLDDNIDGSTLILRYTVSGDANLDGAVGFTDLLQVAANFGQLSGSAVWTDGDLNYDSSITFVDLLAVAANFGGALPSSAELASLPGDQQALVAAAFAAVPEPGALAMIGLAGAALLSRRQRRC